MVQLFRYGLFPRIVLPSAIAFIGLECALGTALILHDFPQWLVPGTIVLILALSALTTWSVSSGRTEDCGCYSGLFVITPQKSILLNLAYILLLDLAWLYPTPDYQTYSWQWIVTLIALPIGSLLGWRSRSKPLIDFSRLKAGKRWSPQWLKDNNASLQQGTHFVVFLGRDCPYCKQWVPLLNVMNTQKDLPSVIGIMSLKPEEIEAFKVQHLVRFPIVQMDRLLFGYLVDSFPIAVLVNDGVIENKWLGEIPKEFFNRIKQFYQSTVFSKLNVRQFSG
ncbi:hypothetical protein H6G63_30680 [Leptolyngbya sp. FACHB-402]|nr:MULTISPECIES: MauE/DoxX family redox-associated membrane protein [Leptolyngbya]MBD2371117.1 hypothetical protein [Leptolyngbya sp. FACHB-161]MBD2377585.1 hypothetical protein [Leptolyngbya sp. FACHB-238]MBD2402038.1 hypothetical protein [Leptolyngbya sp. FACHB-239]MBD2408557.1 hypothetical protein [Leptolyngbya sp. FACHB-402]